MSNKENVLLTIGTVPRAFTGLHKIKQENALNSWVRIEPRPEIILLCDDPGVERAAQEFGCKFVPDIVRDVKYNNVPLISDAFLRLQESATGDIICFTNADIIHLSGMMDAIKRVMDAKSQFIIVGQRWNLNITEAIEFNVGWDVRLENRARSLGTQHAVSAIDYLIFTRDTLPQMPPFLVGCPGWDNWLVASALQMKIPVVNATKSIFCVHQDNGRKWPLLGVEYNRDLAGNNGSKGHISRATWILDKQGLIRSKVK